MLTMKTIYTKMEVIKQFFRKMEAFKLPFLVILGIFQLPPENKEMQILQNLMRYNFNRSLMQSSKT